MATAISGNDSFTKISGSAGQISTLNVSSGKAVSLDVSGSLTAGNVQLTGAGTTTSVIGYAPTAFATAGIASSYNLLIEPSATAAAAVTDAHLLHLPASCVINRVVVTNNGTTVAGGTTFTIGTHNVASGVNKAPTTTAVVSMILASVNSGASVGGTVAVTELALGTAGQALTVSTLAGQAQGAFDNLVSVTTNTSANTAGDLKVEIFYTNA